MMARARHEGQWTHEESIVKGSSQKNRAWVLILLVAAVIGLAVLGYTRFWNLQTVTYELRSCAQPLTEESTWAEVQAAACDPMDPGGVELVVSNEAEMVEPSEVDGSTFTFESMPINSPAPGLRMELEGPARTVVVADPDNERIHGAANGASSATSWSAYIGAGGPQHYWVLITP